MDQWKLKRTEPSRGALTWGGGVMESEVVGEGFGMRVMLGVTSNCSIPVGQFKAKRAAVSLAGHLLLSRVKLNNKHPSLSPRS